jgi:hypothetical protein
VRARGAAPCLAPSTAAAATTTTTAPPAEKVSPFFKDRTPLAFIFFVTARAFIVVVAPLAAAPRAVSIYAVALVAVIVAFAAVAAAAAAPPAPVVAVVVAASYVAANAALAPASIFIIVAAPRTLAVSIKIVVPVVTISGHVLLLIISAKIKPRPCAALKHDPRTAPGDNSHANRTRTRTVDCGTHIALFFDFEGNTRDYRS